ncbi:hypothetical protein ILUMI_02223 [Ignelater luminosus]|uniref:Uncharacterized protein n=1 Tax=Ignelater luminosus TaxID=2038154 RepID=A0A8K0GLJ4_IGNLU|nr:hypothetical protein ILUMI_02223 [Ignelater luminosus]
MFLTKKQFIVFGVAGLVIVVILAIGLGVYFGFKTNDVEEAPFRGGVTSNGHECAAIGSSMLERGGSAVDAAIAALFCEGVAMPQSMGLGGGFLMTIYIRENKTAITLDARETAPIRATENMFDGNASLASKGGLSVAVPSELRGYHYAYEKYGKLPWEELIKPTIELCKRGHLVTSYLARLFKQQEKQILDSPTLKEIFIDPKTNQSYKEGQYIKRTKLAETLEVIAKEGADALYTGSLSEKFVNDIEAFGGIITLEDMKKYKPIWDKPIISKLPHKQTLYTSPLPGAGVIFTFILNILNGYLDYSNINTLTNWQRIVESFKFGYGKRTELGDPAFVPGMQKLIDNLTSPAYAAMIRSQISDTTTSNDPRHYGVNMSTSEDHGTAHISVLAPNGDAVSATSTINQFFGAGIVSQSTGIILNDEMDDFSAPNITNGYGLPPSPANFIVPHKRPLSSMCPSIIVDEHGDVILVIGAAGGTKITTSTALVTIRNLWFNQSLIKAVPATRLHHQLFPMEISVEHDFDKNIVKGLAKIGHNVSIAPTTDGFAALTAMGRFNGIVEGSSDRRRSGQAVLVR